MNCSGVFPVVRGLALTPCFQGFCVIAWYALAASNHRCWRKNRRKFCSRKRAFAAHCVGKNFPAWEGLRFSPRGRQTFRRGGRAQGYRRAQPCAQGWMVYGRCSPFFQLSFSLNFHSLCARVDRGREKRPRAPVWYRARTPSAFFARRRKWRRSRFACLLSLPLRQRGDSFSRSRGSCRHDSPPRPVAQGLRANFSTACSKVIFYYKWGNRDSEFPCCFGFSNRDRA